MSSPNRFRRPLYRFGGHLQIGKQFHLLASLIEGRLLAHHRLHAAHSGRELGIFDIEFDVGGKLAGMAVRAQVIGARYFRLAHCGQDWLGAQLLEGSLATTRTRKNPLTGNWRRKLQ